MPIIISVGASFAVSQFSNVLHKMRNDVVNDKSHEITIVILIKVRIKYLDLPTSRQ